MSANTGEPDLSRRRVREVQARIEHERWRLRRNWVIFVTGLSTVVALAILFARR